MEPGPLVWRWLAVLMVTGCTAEFCEDDPPKIRNAAFKAHTYRKDTIINCECRSGFRRIPSGAAFMQCVGNASHSSWENKCQCIGNSPRTKEKQATPKPEEQKERKAAEGQSQVQPGDQGNHPGSCREPPPWEHEAVERIYHFMVGQTVYYQCLKGYKALQGGFVQSTCKMNHGKTRWTRPQLTCTDEEEHGLLPGEHEPESSSKALPESATSCSLKTTDFQKHTEVVTTMAPFILTREYQVAVASCIFLLISILLLGGLTWQRKCYSLERLSNLSKTAQQSPTPEPKVLLPHPLARRKPRTSPLCFHTHPLRTPHLRPMDQGQNPYAASNALT